MKKRYVCIALAFLQISLVAAQINPYHSDWIDFNKNGKKDIFEDPKQSINSRVANLLLLMNVDEKTAQLATLYGYGRVLKDSLPTAAWKTKIWKDGIANIDEHLNNTTFRIQPNTS